MRLKRFYIFGCIAAALAIVMAAVPVRAYGAAETARSEHNVMNGITETEVYATDSGGRNIRIHILKIDKDSNVSIKASTPNYYKKGSTAKSRKRAASKWGSKSWGFARVDSQAKAFAKSKDTTGTVVAAINGGLYEKNGRSTGNMILEGNVIRKSGKEPFFAVKKGGSYSILSAGSSTKNVKEAVSGHYLVKKGSIMHSNGKDRESRVSIGVTAGGDIVIACVDTGKPSSPGTTVGDMALIMKQQKCKDAINLDGGGSASFCIGRDGKKCLSYRNVTGEAVPRTVSSALLIVKEKGKASGDVSHSHAADMKREGTELRRDERGVYSYVIDGDKQKGFHSINGISYLFAGNGKGKTGKVKIGNVTYRFTKGKLTGASDGKAGKTLIDYCGKPGRETDLIFAFQYGNKKLNIGKNPLVANSQGKMPSWSNIRYVPWRREIYSTKSVVIGKGVKNIGSYFLYISAKPFNHALRNRKPALRSVSLPASLKTIGTSAFLNQSGKVTFTFSTGKPPKFGANALKSKKGGRRHVLRIRKTSGWKKFRNSRSKKKQAGFTGKIVYIK